MQLCEAVYGDFNRNGFPTARICKRNRGHPPISADGIGHSTNPDRKTNMKISRVDPLPKELNIQIILTPEEAKIMKTIAIECKKYEMGIAQQYRRLYTDPLNHIQFDNFVSLLADGLYHAGI